MAVMKPITLHAHDKQLRSAARMNMLIECRGAYTRVSAPYDPAIATIIGRLLRGSERSEIGPGRWIPQPTTRNGMKRGSSSKPWTGVLGPTS